MIVGIDAGNFRTKIAGPRGVQSFYSTFGEDRERNLDDAQYGDDDMVWEYKGRRGFAGSLAIRESEYAASMTGVTKANNDGLIRILLALHRYTDNEKTIDLVAGQPIKGHTEAEKRKIVNMLQDKHDITVNGQRKSFDVRRVGVAPEGAVAGVLLPSRSGWSRVIDVGSGTVNLGSLFDGKFNDRDSDTLAKGTETVKTLDYAAFAREIAAKAKRLGWDEEDYTRLVGGGAEAIEEHLRPYFHFMELYRPTVSGQKVGPEYANAIAFYEIARSAYA